MRAANNAAESEQSSPAPSAQPGRCWDPTDPSGPALPTDKSFLN